MSDFVIVSFLSYVLSVVLFVLLFLSVILCDCAFLSCFFITPPIPPPQCMCVSIYGSSVVLRVVALAPVLSL